MNILGELSLWMALPVAIWGMVLAFVAAHRNRGDLALAAERSVYAVLALTALASAGVVSNFLNDRFQYVYVYGYSSQNLETFYKVAGLWAGQTGSLLFWLLLLMFFAALCVWVNREKNREFMPWVVGVLQAIAVFFLVVLLFADVNPYEQLGYTPADGRGLNPQLQNYWMTVHPPTLYLGFTSFAIPFAFGVAALLSGRLDARWLEVTRKWTLLSWFFLSNGIIFGMRWAYMELGWGGYWFWDPVENASLLPWLTATAFLHSVQIQEKRGMLKVWNMSLVVLTFVLTIFATFLTRSGLIDSVHTFAENTKIAFIFLGFMSSVVVTGAVLILWRRPRLRSENQIESFLSRESAFLFNNLILLGAAFAVLWGTLLPLLTEGFLGEEIQVGPPFFNRVNVPIGLILLALAGIGPVIAWRRATRRNLKRAFVVPVAVAVGVMAVLAVVISRGRDAGAGPGVAGTEWMALVTFGIGAFVLAVIVIEFWKGTKARAHIEGEGFARALYHLVLKNRRRWGGYIVHVGVVLIFAAFAGAAWDVRIEQALEPGQTALVESPFGHTYELYFEGISTGGAFGNPNAENSRNIDYQALALFSVAKDGEPLGTLSAERRFYQSPPLWMTEVGVRSAPLEDLYVILELDDANLDAIFNDAFAGQSVQFTFLVNPLVSFIWLGGLVLTLGSLIAMWPEPERVRVTALRAAPRIAPAAPASAAAD